MVQKLTCRQAQWSLFLLQFWFLMKYKPEKSMLNADPLFRRTDHKKGVEDNNLGKTLLKLQYFEEKWGTGPYI